MDFVNIVENWNLVGHEDEDADYIDGNGEAHICDKDSSEGARPVVDNR